MNDVERRYTRGLVEVRAEPDAPQQIGGYAAKFMRLSQNLGGFVEQIEPRFFAKSQADGWPGVMARYNHSDNMLLGTTAAGTLRLAVDATGLDYTVVPPSSRADVVELVQRGDVRQSSFAFRTFEDEWAQTEQGFPLRTLVSGALVDVAPVNSPAYPDTSTGLRSLAAQVGADPDEVLQAAAANELRRFFAHPPATVIDMHVNRNTPDEKLQEIARQAAEAALGNVEGGTEVRETVSDEPWSNFTPADYDIAQWRRACLIDTGEGAEDSKGRYKLPVREPDGDLNRNGVHAAAGGHGLGAVTGISDAQRTAAAKTLISLYRDQLTEDPPESLLAMAGMRSAGQGEAGGEVRAAMVALAAKQRPPYPLP
ncbi:HK97 family phage prohead protease [Actinomadura rupiterrae]|uniref:HK97 family phage prohead protease n=1 Tax=Actinomadura rupiterrae TaxID=559627 RepID=UPI0020A58D1E|nr:HK97 family phage prohead protease [Actinomadura rupiterrae]MCP2339173.1 HK97 family phage prohead protease [Actinomadura rupiterrae]